MKDGWLSWPCWLTDSGRLNRKVITHPASSLAQDRESSPAETSVLTNMLRHHYVSIFLTYNIRLYDIFHRVNKQAVGGRPPRYAPPRPAPEARSGSLEPGRPSRARSANTRHPAGRPHKLPADRMYATDVRQTDVRQDHRLMSPGRGHKK